jgi:hypothetical protein
MDSSTEQGVLSQRCIRHQEVNGTLQLHGQSSSNQCVGQDSTTLQGLLSQRSIRHQEVNGTLQFNSRSSNQQ